MVDVSETKHRFLEGTLHPVNVLMCPHSTVTNLPKPRQKYSGMKCIRTRFLSPFPIQFANAVLPSEFRSSNNYLNFGNKLILRGPRPVMRPQSSKHFHQVKQFVTQSTSSNS